MSVNVVQPHGMADEAFPMWDNGTRQLFVAVKDKRVVKTFWVDHAKHSNATAYLASNPKHGVAEFDFVRSATVQEGVAYFDEKRGN